MSGTVSQSMCHEKAGTRPGRITSQHSRHSTKPMEPIMNQISVKGPHPLRARHQITDQTAQQGLHPLQMQIYMRKPRHG